DRDVRRLPRLEEPALVAELARLALALRVPRPLPDLVERQPKRRAPELRLLDLQRLRELPRQPRLVADLVLPQADLGRDDRACNPRCPALRRPARSVDRPRRDGLVRSDGALGAKHRDVRTDARRGRTLARGRDAAR